MVCRKVSEFECNVGASHDRAKIWATNSNFDTFI